MAQKIEFKDTEIGKIPKEWDVVKVEEVTEIHDSKRIPLSEIERNKRRGSFPYCGATGIIDYIDDYIFDGEFILLAEDGGDYGKFEKSVYIMNGKFWVNNHAHILKTKKDKTTNLFLCYIFNFFDLNFYIVGSTRKKLNQERMKKILISLPPLPEQKKIAEILSTVDQAIEKVDEATARTKRLKKGLMRGLLTKGIGHKDFKDTEIGRIPKEWEVVRIGDISLDSIGGGTPSTSNPGYWNGDIAWMTSAHINGREIKTGQRYITKEGLQNSVTSVVPKDNLLVATRVGIGKAATNKIDIAISQDLTGIVINKDKSIPDFVYWYLVNNKNRLKALAQGSTIKGILREGLRNLKLPLPLLPEQKKIAEILSTVDKRIQLLRERKERLGRVKKGLMNDLLTGKKRVRSDI